MDINFKNKNELTFLGIGILMVVIVVFALIWAISFLTSNISGAVEKQGNGGNQGIQFQVDRAEAVLTR